MNRRMIVPSGQMNRHHYLTPTSNQPFSYSHQQQPSPPRKQIQYDADAITQSRSFKILQGWISDSEKSVPASPRHSSSIDLALPLQVSPDEQHHVNHRASLSEGVSSLPSRSFRYLQEQYKDNTTVNSTPETTIPLRNNSAVRRSTDDAHTPSRAFQYLHKQLPVNRSLTVNNRDDLQEIYNKTPPSIREHEPEAPRYRGATVPSRSFRFLQMMTQEHEQKDPKPSIKSPQSDHSHLLSNESQVNDHSFKSLQERTGTQSSWTPTSPAGRMTSNNGQSSFYMH